MSADLDPRLLSVGELFGDHATHYEIPIYQRNYAWGVEQIEQLIDDVWAAAQGEAEEYFLGNLIVSRQTVRPGTRVVTFEVVDGQQRLTTLFLLLRYVQAEIKARLTYQSRRGATDALERITDSDDEESAGIHAGYKAIKSRMGNFGDNERAAFANFLQQKVQVVRATLPTNTDLNRYFEIMNTRGQQLEQADIVKARLMSYLASDDGDAERRCLGWVWDACADMDSYIQMALTPGNTDLRASVFGPDWDRLHRATFTDLLQLQPQRSGHDPRSERGSMSLREALHYYASSTVSAGTEDVDNQRFETPIKFPVLLLHALTVLRGTETGGDDDGQLDDSRLIELFDRYFEGLPETERASRTREFVETLLRSKFVLDNYILKREFTATNGQDGAWSLKRLTRGESTGRKLSARFPNAFSPGTDEWEDAPIDDGTRDVLLLQSMLRVTYTSPRSMHWITVVLREPLTGLTWTQAGERIREVLRNHARVKVKQAYFTGERPTGFGIERIVFTYLDYLLASGASADHEQDPGFTFVFRTSIEHFFPQYPDPEQEGWDRIKVSDPSLHMLGNLALVSVGANSKFSNNLPENKIRFESTIRQSAKLMLMSDRIRSGQTWDSKAIEDHDAEMHDLLLADFDRGTSPKCSEGKP